MRDHQILFKTVAYSLWVAISCFCVTGLAQAQEADSTVTLTVEEVLNLSISNENVTQTVTEANLAEDFLELPSGQPTLSVTTNTNWRISVQALSGFFSKDGDGGSEELAASSLSVKSVSVPQGSDVIVTNGFVDFTALSASQENQMFQGEKLTNTDLPCQYRLNTQGNISPGTYELDVRYTLATRG